MYLNQVHNNGYEAFHHWGRPMRMIIGEPEEVSSTGYEVLDNSGKAMQRLFPAPYGGTTLLAFPPEVRNILWEPAVIDQGGPITIKAGNIAPPALLQVNRQIRKEAIAMYYTYNEFRVEITDYDALPVLPFIDRFCKYSWYWPTDDHYRIVTLAFDGDANWQNLCTWLLAEWERGIEGIVCEHMIIDDNNRVLNGLWTAKQGMMGLVETGLLRKGLAWIAFEATLRGQRRELSGTDGNWLLDRGGVR